MRGDEVVVVRPRTAAGDEVAGAVRAVEQGDQMQRTEKISSRSHKRYLYIISGFYRVRDVRLVRLPREDPAVYFNETSGKIVRFYYNALAVLRLLKIAVRHRVRYTAGVKRH